MARTEPLELMPRSSSKWFGRLLIAFLLFLLLSLSGLIGLLEPAMKAGFFLVAGWIWFLGRVVPEIHFNWAAIGMFVACSALVIGGIQWLGRTLAEKGGWVWSWRWPWGIFLGCWILFLAAMGFTGAVHQVGWLFSSGEPWIQNRHRTAYDFSDVLQVRNYVRIALADTQEASSERRTAILDESRLYRDTCTVLCFPADAGPVRAVLVLPRSPEALRRHGFIRIEADGSSREESGHQLASTLERLNAGNFEPRQQP